MDSESKRNGMCLVMEPLVAEVALGIASSAVQDEVQGHCDSCAACSSSLSGAKEADGLLSTPLLASANAGVRATVLAKVRQDLTPVTRTRAIASIAFATAFAIVALALTTARTPLASGLPLLVCVAAWTGAIALAVHLTVSGSPASRWPRAALSGVGAVLVMSLLCPPPSLALMSSTLLQTSGMASELLVGLLFGIIPIAIALVIARGASASLATMASIGAVLLGAELPLIFAQCCDVPTVNAWPVLAGTLAGALLLAMAAFLITHLRGDQQRNLYV